MKPEAAETGASSVPSTYLNLNCADCSVFYQLGEVTTNLHRRPLWLDNKQKLDVASVLRFSPRESRNMALIQPIDFSQKPVYSVRCED
jgi:hypothetical protein